MNIFYCLLFLTINYEQLWIQNIILLQYRFKDTQKCFIIVIKSHQKLSYWDNKGEKKNELITQSGTQIHTLTHTHTHTQGTAAGIYTLTLTSEITAITNRASRGAQGLSSPQGMSLQSKVTHAKMGTLSERKRGRNGRRGTEREEGSTKTRRERGD